MIRKKIVLLIGIILFIISCSNNEPGKQKLTNSEIFLHAQYLSEIKKYEDEMHKSIEINNVIGGLAIKAYVDFSENFPDDSLTPHYLFKAGEIAIVTQQYPQALKYYKRITDKYPEFKLIQESLFFQGYILDNFLNDEAQAKSIYEKIIAKYPTTTFANDAKSAIYNLGKTDEELINEFKKKNGQK